MIEPLRCCINYRLEGESSSANHIASFRIAEVEKIRVRGDVELLVDYGVEGLNIVMRPLKPMRILSSEVEFHREFTEKEKVLLNGYQSWTDTVELSPWARQRGITRLPSKVVNYFTLDGSGDYRFKDYANSPGELHGWTYAYCKNGDEVEFVGSLNEDAGFTLLRLDAFDSRVYASKEPPARVVRTGEDVSILNIAYLVARGDDALERLYDRWFEKMDVTARRTMPLCGYSSWYRHYGNIDESKLLGDLASAKRAFAKLNADGFEKVFQIDDGYCRVGDWKSYDRGRFPSGMARIARRIADDGFTPGLWMAPFVCEEKSRLAEVNSAWLMRDEKGDPVKSGSHWSGGLALDTRNKEVRAYVTDCVKTAVQEWGFKMLKLDFLYAACMIPHDGLNRGQLMADACKLLRDAAGEDVVIDGCGVPLVSAFGVFDCCRVGCDVGLDWDGVPHRRITERERVSTRNSLANTVYRAPLNRRAFLNDPDVVLIREDVKLTKEQRQMHLDAAAVFGGMLLTSDDMGAWNDDQLAAYQRCLDYQRQVNR